MNIASYIIHDILDSISENICEETFTLDEEDILEDIIGHELMTDDHKKNILQIILEIELSENTSDMISFRNEKRSFLNDNWKYDTENSKRLKLDDQNSDNYSQKVIKSNDSQRKTRRKCGH